MIRQGVHAARSLVDLARNQRQERTPATARMWSMLRGRHLEGLKFRREHQIANYIVDFYCLELKLVIELDGQQHFDYSAIEADARRTEALQRMGCTVIRFENVDVVENPKIVVEQILRIVQELRKLRRPSP